jgi:hypothetical protein
MSDQPLAAERAALSLILTRLMAEVHDLETLCKHTPRIISVATTAARTQATLASASESDSLAEIRQALSDVEAEEEQPW